MSTTYAMQNAGGESGMVTGGVTPTMNVALQKTKPWVFFLGILTIIGSSLALLLFGLGTAGITQVVMQKTVAQPVIIYMFSVFGLFLLMGITYFMMGINLVSYGSSIGRLKYSQSSSDMEQALTAQKKYWRKMGMLTLFSILLFVTLMVLVGLFPEKAQWLIRETDALRLGSGLR